MVRVAHNKHGKKYPSNVPLNVQRNEQWTVRIHNNHKAVNGSFLTADNGTQCRNEIIAIPVTVRIRERYNWMTLGNVSFTNYTAISGRRMKWKSLRETNDVEDNHKKLWRQTLWSFPQGNPLE